MINNKTNKKMRRLLTIFVFISMYALSYAQYSTLDRFNSHKGIDVLIRTDYSRTYFVTYEGQTSSSNCRFIVQHNDTTRYMNLLQNYENSLPNPMQGFEIKDMRIIGQECYFCGCKWVETGNIIYNLDGTMTFERKREGIIGRFDVRNVIRNGGSYEIMEIDTVRCLNKLAVLSGRALAVGTLYDGYTPCLFYLREVYYSSGETDYNYRVITSNISGETFSDVTASDNKFIVVSRYNTLAGTTQYKYRFGLRYGTGYNFFSTNTGIYDYNIQNVLGNEGASFVTMEPALITSTKTDDEVVVGYINRKLSNRQGMPIFYKIPYSGSNISKILVALEYGDVKYNKLKEIQYNNKLVSTSRMVVLLEDSYGNSVLRFPDWNIVENWYDTALYTSSYKLQSIAPFQYLSSSLELLTAGYEPNNQNRVVQLFTYDIHGYKGKWATLSCIPYSKKTIEEIRNFNAPVTSVESPLNNYFLKSHILFTQVSFTPQNTSESNICNN